MDGSEISRRPWKDLYTDTAPRAKGLSLPPSGFTTTTRLGDVQRPLVESTEQFRAPPTTSTVYLCNASCGQALVMMELDK